MVKDFKGYFTIIFFILIILYKFYNGGIIYFNIDEIYSINFYSNFYTFFVVSLPNNHVLTNFLGALGTIFFGYNIYYFKFVSFFFLFLTLLIFNSFFRDYKFLLFFFLLFFLSDNLYNYSYLFRGYYLSSFIFSLVFILLYKNFLFFTKKNFNIIFLLLVLLTVHSVYVLFLVFPILISNFYLAKKTLGKKAILINFLIFFVLPLFILEFTKLALTGLFNLRKVVNLSDFNSLFYYFITDHNTLPLEPAKNQIYNFFLNLLNVIGSGINLVYLNDWIYGQLYKEKYIISYRFFINDPVLFFIFFFSMLFSIKNLIQKNFNILDFIILFFFIISFLSMKRMPERTYIGYVGFFIFYLFHNIKYLKFFNFQKKLFNIFFFLFIFLISLNKSLVFKDFNIWDFDISKSNNFCYLQEVLNPKIRNQEQELQRILDIYNYFIKCPYSDFKSYLRAKYSDFY